MKTHSKLGVTIPNDYLVYTALILQTGTDDPIATVLKNTLGGTIVWEYDNVGVYYGVLVGAFTVGKTWLIINQEEDDPTEYRMQRGSSDHVKIKTFSSGVPTNGLLGNASVEIRIYP